MAKTIIILFLLITQFSVQGQSANTRTLQGDVYINLAFVKVGEDHESYPLEKLIRSVQPRINEIFASRGIHFVYERTTEYLNSREVLVRDWEDHTLPVFDDRLTVYIYPEETLFGEAHEYRFRRVSSEIALVPVYNEEEFAQFLAKNLLYMLGLPLPGGNVNDAWVSNDLAYNELNALSSLQASKKLKARKKSRGYNQVEQDFMNEDWAPGGKLVISDEEALNIRRNLSSMLHLKNKLFTLPTPAFAISGKPTMATILEP
ncbi:MAG: hypothetical protein ACPF9D_10750 [Owenweeksia sp.]